MVGSAVSAVLRAKSLAHSPRLQQMTINRLVGTINQTAARLRDAERFGDPDKTRRDVALDIAAIALIYAEQQRKAK